MPEEDNREEGEGLNESEFAERIAGLIGTTPSPEEKQNVHTFLHNVAVADDTTKTGFLNDAEIGIPTLPQRTYQELALFCSEVANMDYFADYFLKKSEILTSTSLSKEAKLINLAVLQKKQIEDVTKPQRKPSSSWFKPKHKVNEEE